MFNTTKLLLRVTMSKVKATNAVHFRLLHDVALLE